MTSSKNPALSFSADQADKKTFWAILPEKVCIIGRDVKLPKHPAYDPRAELPADEGLVQSIFDNGWFGSIEVFKDDALFAQIVADGLLPADHGFECFCFWGRQRTVAARVANERYAALGRPERIRMTVSLPKIGASIDVRGRVMAENRRVGETFITIAKKAKAWIEIEGDSKESWARLAASIPDGRWSVRQLKDFLSVIEADPSLEEAVVAGDMSWQAAYNLTKLPVEQQRGIVEQVRAEKAAEVEAANAEVEATEDEEPGDAEEASGGKKAKKAKAAKKAEKAAKKKGLSARDAYRAVQAAKGKFVAPSVNEKKAVATQMRGRISKEAQAYLDWCAGLGPLPHA